MKVNRIRFSKILRQRELDKMVEAYIEAERIIVSSANAGFDITGIDSVKAVSFEALDPSQFHPNIDAFGNVIMSDRGKLEKQRADLEEKGRRALEEEDYEKMKLLKKIYDVVVGKLKKLDDEQN